MKKLYLLGSMLLAVCSAHANTDPIIEKGTLDQIQTQLARSEYFIHWQNYAGIYQSTNRKNSLRATYTAQEMHIAPRDASQQWSFGLTVKGVAADGRPLYRSATQTAVKLNDGTVQFNHDNHYTVEYVNNEDGIRQNFIIQQPAVKAHTINVQLQAAEGWQIAKRNETSLTFSNGQQLLSYNDLKVWDAKGTILPAQFSVHNNQFQIAVDVEKAVYPVTIDPIVLNGTPQNANTFLQSNQSFAFLGYSVSSAGDINGDNYDDIVLGAPGYDHPNGGNGAAFVYYGSNRGINPTRFSMLTSNIVSGQDGTLIAGGGDVNDDGFDDIVTTASYDSTINLDGICIYYGAASGITTTPVIIYGNPAYGTFADAITISKDLDGDFIDDIVVGSGYGSHGQTGEGIVTIIPGSPWGAEYTAWTVIEGNQLGLHLGNHVKSAGDVNGDSYNDLIIGTGNMVLVYFGGPGGLATTPGSSLTITAGSIHPPYALAAGGDINGDGHTDIIVGKTVYSNGQSQEGAVWVYYGNATGIDTIPATILEGNADSISYGVSVAFAGDINNDGFSDIVVGALGQSNDINQKGEGMAYVYYGRATGLNPVPASTIQSNQKDALLGISVAGAGDVNGDGYSDVVIGAMLYTNGQEAEGAAFVYHGGAGSAGLLAATTAGKMTASPADPFSAVKVFPNPTVNNLSVQLQGLDSQLPTEIQIMNLQGRIVQVVKAGNIDSYQQSVDLSRLTAGIYFVVIRNGSKVFREKIIKQ
ncbi:FG-GAP-like repeat-containing protein [Chitinophaga pinensis]|uniref:FG-GAP repeat protein n=1 Tax=Chitinophaga pinensis (strain ATCC 43595 / DSM 2588 / LMG 13176 / NBRC 15968 / NCIMB 11800 / UQM 2034) TaxID=485918 RepID=A0A979GSV9_CHIPD|nr:FG-GAP-like repeat-containing protein [Chitinophaga pinensis]ACU61653.1 FG-GAP repeat protein [Chitinophaga pinensis DSM 2588]